MQATADLSLSLLFEATFGIVMKGTRALTLLRGQGLNLDNSPSMLRAQSRLGDRSVLNSDCTFPPELEFAYFFFRALCPEWEAEVMSLESRGIAALPIQTTPLESYSRFRPKVENNMFKVLSAAFQSDDGSSPFVKIQKAMLRSCMQTPESEPNEWTPKDSIDKIIQQCTSTYSSEASSHTRSVDRGGARRRRMLSAAWMNLEGMPVMSSQSQKNQVRVFCVFESQPSVHICAHNFI